MATSGDLLLATPGDFLMATDTEVQPLPGARSSESELQGSGVAVIQEPAPVLV